MNKIIIRVRGIIIHDGKLLLVKITKNNYYCLPGGKLEHGEDVKDCMKRELTEELGIEPEVGNLLYVNTFIDEENNHNLDFVFQILNGSEYFNKEKLEGSHSFELDNIIWISKEDKIDFMPQSIIDDFQKNNISPNTIKYLK